MHTDDSALRSRVCHAVGDVMWFPASIAIIFFLLIVSRSGLQSWGFALFFVSAWFVTASVFMAIVVRLNKCSIVIDRDLVQLQGARGVIRSTPIHKCRWKISKGGWLIIYPFPLWLAPFTCGIVPIRAYLELKEGEREKWISVLSGKNALQDDGTD